MAWDFRTDPDLGLELAWIREIVAEIEPAGACGADVERVGWYVTLAVAAEVELTRTCGCS